MNYYIVENGLDRLANSEDDAKIKAAQIILNWAKNTQNNYAKAALTCLAVKHITSAITIYNTNSGNTIQIRRDGTSLDEIAELARKALYPKN